jgi:hypothetical protein
MTLCTETVSRQRHGKHVPVAMQQIFNNETVGRNNRKVFFYVVRAEMLKGRDKFS